jgi:hypothetical protein
VQSGGQVLTFGEVGAGWTAGDVAVPVTRVERTVAHTTICVIFEVSDETVVLVGKRTTVAATAITGADGGVGLRTRRAAERGGVVDPHAPFSGDRRDLPFRLRSTARPHRAGADLGR